ncbi:FecR domain-containing protein [Sphingomonas sp. DG1-23]|uniref:FecR domain-containing protein n=1 Tax=Sphingomonas sp. DG1-23 TaxID=3068316 RepID=UPI00273EA092|nr:FecR domain-containing protein [Sphingomonas sp. DG1-23]MDP5280044.1 FecR domain-containing protein [Sphingomonas sp. DG1-23]
MFLAAAMQTAPLLSQPSQSDVVTYTVRRGDTLDRLSRSFLVPERRWRSLLGLARIRNPRRLPIGRQLRIPRAWLRFKVEPARLASYRGTVRLAIGGKAVSPAPGALVGEGTEVATAANSFVTLLLADRSQVVIPSQSRVRVRELRRILLTGTIDYRIDVEQGRLETKVTPLDQPSGRYRIHTPVSMTAVRGTEFRVSFDAQSRTAATEVLAGTVALSAPGGPTALALEPSFGATLDQGGEPHREKLLAAPDLDDPAPLQTRDAVEFRARRLADTIRYRVLIASDAGFIDNIAEQFSDDGVFALPDIPNGTLFVRVSAIARSGLEGMAQAYSFKRRLASIHGTVEAGEDGYRFRWSGAGGGVRRYRFQLTRDTPQGRLMVDEVALARDALTLRRLPGGVYYWRVGLVQLEDGEAVESWTDPAKLTITDSSRSRRR